MTFDLNTTPTETLEVELHRRSAERMTVFWQNRIANAQYLCPDCGMPDSWHTPDCISDTECD